jgi:hypothetical protein
MLVQLNHTAHYATIILEMGVPKRVSEHDIRSAVWAMLIGGVKELAKIGLQAQCVEVVPASFLDPVAGCIFARIQPGQSDVISHQTFKAAVAVPQIEIVGIRLRHALVRAPESVEALRVGHIQRAQQERIHNAEHHRVRSYRQRQRQNRGYGEAGRLAQPAQAEAHILYNRLDEIAAQSFVAFLLVLLPAPELDACAAFRLGAAEPGTFQIIGAMLDVGAKLLLDLGVYLGTLKKSGDAEAKPIQKFHTSSGC